MIKCPYCKKEPTDLKNGCFECRSCSGYPRLVFSGSWNEPNLWYIQFRQTVYVLEIDVQARECYLCSNRADHQIMHPTITKLSYIPSDLNPDTAQDWITRLLNIKAFA